jgi:hypothetical protein
MAEKVMGGAKRRETKPFYHHIPLEALRRLARTYEEGAYKYSQETSLPLTYENWKQGNAEFFSDAFNHVVEHIFAWAQGLDLGEPDEDHLAHAAFGLFALMWAEEKGILPAKIPLSKPAPPPSRPAPDREPAHAEETGAPARMSPRRGESSRAPARRTLRRGKAGR